MKTQAFGALVAATAAMMVASVGCGDDAEPFATERAVDVVWTGSTTVALSRLRYGAYDGFFPGQVRVETPPLATFADVALTATTATTALTLRAPAGGAQYTYGLALSETEIIAIVPIAFVTYLDVDDSSDLGVGDLVVAESGFDVSGWAYLPDREAQLSLLSLRAQLYFRELVPDARELFIARPDQYGGGVFPPPVAMELESAAARAFRLGCALSTTLPLVRTTSVVIAPGIDPLRACGLDASSCLSAPLEPLGSPVIPEGEATRAQCRPRSDLEFLLVETLGWSRSLDSCTEGPTSEVLAYVSTASAAPSWWPCGDTVERCDTGSSPLTVDSSCP